MTVEVVQQIAPKVRRYLQALAFHFCAGFWPVAVLVAAPHGGGQQLFHRPLRCQFRCNSCATRCSQSCTGFGGVLHRCCGASCVLTPLRLRRCCAAGCIVGRRSCVLRLYRRATRNCAPELFAQAHFLASGGTSPSSRALRRCRLTLDLLISNSAAISDWLKPSLASATTRS